MGVPGAGVCDLLRSGDRSEPSVLQGYPAYGKQSCLIASQWDGELYTRFKQWDLYQRQMPAGNLASGGRLAAGNITFNATAWNPEDSVVLTNGRKVVITTTGKQSRCLRACLPSTEPTSLHAINNRYLDIVVCGHITYCLVVGPTCGGLTAAWSSGGTLLD